MNNGFYEFSRGRQETTTTSSVFPYTGSAIISGSLIVSGSTISTEGFTGSLFGTSSFAVSASWAPTQTINTSSLVTTSSFNAFTSSYNTGSFTGLFTGSLFGTSSWSNNSITSSYITSSNVYGPFGANSILSASYANYALTASNSQNAQDILIYVKNISGAQINKGKVVRISGATGDNALISTASYESDGVSANTLGITTQNIPNDSFGYVITEGTLLGIDTNAFLAGQLLYLGATGSIIGTAPQAPLHAVRLGQVLRVQQNNGSIYVRIDNGYELGELHDVRDTTTTSSYGDLLVRSGSVWTNSRQLTGSYGLTGSLTATSFTGSLQGTASFTTSASFAISSSISISSSFASTASFITSLDATPTSGSTNGVQSGGVFSALTLKQNNTIKVGYLTNTGVTGQTVVASLLIPANWLENGDGFEIVFTPHKSVTAANISFNMYHDTVLNGITNTIATNSQLSTAQRTGYMQRILSLDGNTLRNSMITNVSSNIPISSNSVGSTTTFNPAVNNYITITANPTVISETFGVNQIFIRKL